MGKIEGGVSCSMCIVHNKDFLKEWLPSKPFRAYKQIFKNTNASTWNPRFIWSVGVHSVKVQRCTNETGRGFYVYLDRKDVYNDRMLKAIAVYVDPKDVVYAGLTPSFGLLYERVFVVRRLTIKSVHGLREKNCA